MISDAPPARSEAFDNGVHFCIKAWMALFFFFPDFWMALLGRNKLDGHFDLRGFHSLDGTVAVPGLSFHCVVVTVARAACGVTRL